ncbi:hypothetical protein IJJ27_00925 [bacterium]|nr:hypothetical protein [bacterium]
MSVIRSNSHVKAILPGTRHKRQARPVYRQSLSRPWLIKLLWGALILAIIILVRFGLDHYFIVTQVYCRLGRGSTPCPASLQRDVQTLIGKPMLFYNYTAALEKFRTPALPFSGVNYQKLLPGVLFAQFDFGQPLYQLQASGQNFSFDDHGVYTILPSEQELPTFIVDNQSLLLSLNDYQLDQIIHQKLWQLLYLSRGQLLPPSTITIKEDNLLQVETKHAVYLLDLFNLDEDWQQLEYLESYRQNSEKQEIDLRLSLPVVRPVSD